MSLGSPEPSGFPEERQPTKKLLAGPHWTLWFVYSVITLNAVYGEFGTSFSNATFGFYYIVIGMTGWAVAWLALLLADELGGVPRNLLRISALVAALAVVGYLGINR